MEDVSDQGYNGIIRIRSYLGEQLAPNNAEFECEVCNRYATVNLLATLANVK